MKNVATEVLSRQGHSVMISDLYALGFSATAQKWDFVTTTGEHFNYMFEQKHAVRLEMSFSPDIMGEINKVQAADIVLFVFPIWWFSAPAIMKGWFDRVLAMGVTWDGGKIYENGLMRGKQAMVITCGGGPEEYYRTDNRHKATPTQILHPINHGTLAFCGFNVHEPYVALNVLGAGDEGRAKYLKELEFRLQNLTTSPQWLVQY
jgi:NAD(P)H dehydrogenase (quinone)